jgi:hypothetical protein
MIVGVFEDRFLLRLCRPCKRPDGRAERGHGAKAEDTTPMEPVTFVHFHSSRGWSKQSTRYSG